MLSSAEIQHPSLIAQNHRILVEFQKHSVEKLM